MNKIIIQNDSALDMPIVFEMVRCVIDMGAISGSGDKAQSCYYAEFTEGSVTCVKNDKSERFIINDLRF